MSEMRDYASMMAERHRRRANESEFRQWLIDRIEGWTGILETMPYDRISTEDLETISFHLEMRRFPKLNKGDRL